MKIVVSACLLGHNCKYNGKNNYNDELMRLLKGHNIIPICPEVMGGLPTPRHPAEIVNGVVINTEGVSVDREYRIGAEKALEIANLERADLIILQSRSPSCGVKQIYDGTYSKTLIDGEGVFASLCRQSGFIVWDVADILRLGCLPILKSSNT